MRYVLIASFALMMLAGCGDDKENGNYRDITYTFNDVTSGWTSLFSDYPQGADSSYALEFKIARLPLPLDTSKNALKISGFNYNDDLATYMYTTLTGLAPEVKYKVSFAILLASNIPSGGINTGNSPNLFIGVGALDTIPSNHVDHDGILRPTFQSDLINGNSTEDLKVVGQLGVAETTSAYTQIGRDNLNHPIEVTSRGDGKIYLLIGWDSGYLGTTTVYIKSIMVTLEY
jgi:hypothetical protein